MLAAKPETITALEVTRIIFVVAYNDLKDIRQGGPPVLGLSLLVYRPDTEVVLELLKYHLKDIGQNDKVLEIRQEPEL